MPRTLLNCTSLEDRTTPATAFVIGKTLYVSDQNGKLVVETTRFAGELRVQDSVTEQFFKGATTVSILGTAASNGITLGGGDATHKAFTQTVFLDSGLGNDIIQLHGRFTKNVQLATGPGDDTVRAAIGNAHLSRDLVWNDDSGTNLFTTNGLGVRVDGALTLNGASQLQMAAEGSLRVGGAMTIVAPTELSTNGSYNFDGASTILKKGLTVLGGPLDDALNITGKLTCSGNINVDFQEGNNSFVLTPTRPTNTTPTIMGQGLTYRGATGADVVVLGSDLTLKKDVIVALGGGINTFVDTPTTTSRNLTANGGSSSDTFVIQGNILGRLDIATGDGDGDTTIFTGTIRSKQFRYTGSTGLLNTLTIAPTVAQKIVLEAYFIGESTFSLGPNVTLDGVVLGQGASFMFNPGTAILLPTLVLTGF